MEEKQNKCGCLSGGGGWWWGENNTNLAVVVAVAGNKNKNVAVVEVYSFTIHGTVLK